MEIRQISNGNLLDTIPVSNSTIREFGYCESKIAAYDRDHVWLLDISKSESRRDVSPPVYDHGVAITVTPGTDALYFTKTAAFRLKWSGTEWQELRVFSTRIVCVSEIQSNCIAIVLETGTIEICNLQDFKNA